jgi:iron-sulfur cluster assembly accessory protein
MISITDKAVGKVREIMAQRSEAATHLRIGVMGGGCSGFQYSMAFDNNVRDDDKVLEYDGFKVLVDQKSMLYLMGAEVDYIESLTGSGFKFNNPNARTTCGCGESFNG